MKKIFNSKKLSSMKGGTNWYECTYLSAGTVVTIVFVPLAGIFMAGASAACWSKVQ